MSKVNYKTALLQYIILSITIVLIIINLYDIQFDLIYFIFDLPLYNILAIILLFSLFIIFDGLSFKPIGNAINKNINLYTGILAGTLNELISSITPLQSGGQPIEIYILMKNGSLKFQEAFIITYTRMLCNITVLTISSILAILLYNQNYSNSLVISMMIYYSIIIVFLFIFTAYLIIYKINYLTKIIKYILNILVKFKIINNNSSIIENYENTIKELSTIFKFLFFNKIIELIQALIITALSIYSKYLMIYFVINHFELYVSIDKLILFQGFIALVNYGIPTPGAVGVTEFFSYNIFKSIIISTKPIVNLDKKIAIIVIIWRMITHNMTLILGVILSIINYIQSIKNNKFNIKINKDYFSPNFSKTKRLKPRFIILHYTAVNLEKTFKIFNIRRISSIDPETNLNDVSAHYVVPNLTVIDNNYPIYEIVSPSEYKVAYHAGVSAFGEFKNVRSLNEYAIGIEIIYTVDTNNNKYYYNKYNIQQIDAVIKLVKQLQTEYGIDSYNILGHNDISPNRKLDPGPLFPWSKLFKHNIGLWYNSERVNNYINLIKNKSEFPSIFNKMFDLLELSNEEIISSKDDIMNCIVPTNYIKIVSKLGYKADGYDHKYLNRAINFHFYNMKYNAVEYNTNTLHITNPIKLDTVNIEFRTYIKLIDLFNIKFNIS